MGCHPGCGNFSLPADEFPAAEHDRMDAYADDRTLVQLLDSLGQVGSSEDLLAWAQRDLQRVLPHRGFLCGFGRVHRAGIAFAKLYSSNLPLDFVRAQKQADGQYTCPVVRQWLRDGEVQLVDAAPALLPELDPAWQSRMSQSGLSNVAAYGMHDFSRHYASYFTFYNITEPLGERQRFLLRLMGPALHAALLRVVHALKAASAAVRRGRELTERELEVLGWVCEGKTSAEIAAILNVSQSTVRNQTQSILVKLRVNTRAQAAAKAIKKGLVVPRHPDSVFGSL